MQRIPREQARKYAFDWRDEPLLHVASGETFEIETYDASTGYFKTEQDLAIPAQRPGFDRNPPLANPIGGPVFVEGARKGDTLVVTIESITVDDYSWIAIGPRRGPLGDSASRPELSKEYTTRIFRHTPGPSGTTRDGTLHFGAKDLSWPITPFIGTLGVCPDREVTTSVDGQGDWGGNLEIRDVAPGNRSPPPVPPAAPRSNRGRGRAAARTRRCRDRVRDGRVSRWLRMRHAPRRTLATPARPGSTNRSRRPFPTPPRRRGRGTRRRGNPPLCPTPLAASPRNPRRSGQQTARTSAAVGRPLMLSVPGGNPH